MKALWKRLSQVHRLSLHSQSGMSGSGQVKVKTGLKSLIFVESGEWSHPVNISFYNILRWKVDFSTSLISLEHLRFGSSQPVFLFHLKTVGPHIFQSLNSHVCKNDCYSARIEMSEHHLNFIWDISGPRKKETLFYSYES
ncbi:MAG TPA: DUF6314 family protein [Rhabdochlamydiaceae bacterium]|nr:DUF6314 family protein [Rhabdochlamydiaceae bacterium]